MITRVYILGAGNHARELSEYVISNPSYALGGYIVNIRQEGFAREGVKIFSLEEFLDQFPPAYDIRLISGFSDLRRRPLIELLENSGYHFLNVIHTHNYLSPSMAMGKGNCVAPGCVLNANVKIGNHCIININCAISHDAHIGDFSVVSPGVTIAGNVRIGEEVFVGSGVSIIPNIIVGNGAYIAAGTCVTRDVPENVLVAGVPAKIKRELLPRAV